MPSISGSDFTPTRHDTVTPTTDPRNVTLPPNFTVAILGASRGIGFGIAKAYARAKAANLMLAGRTMSTLETAAREVLSIHPACKVVCQICDVTSEDDVRELVEATRTGFGRLDVLVVNAGLATKVGVRRDDGRMDWPVNFLEQDVAEFETLLRINVLAPFMVMKEFLPLLQESEDGAKAVIYIGSASAHYIDAEQMAASYSVTKMAGTRLIEHCHEGHHKKHGINAFAIQPGGVKTDMAATVPEGKGWEALLTTHVELAGSVCVWLTKERRDWLSGRYIDARWDFDELEQKKEQIVDENLLKFRMRV